MAVSELRFLTRTSARGDSPVGGRAVFISAVSVYHETVEPTIRIALVAVSAGSERLGR
jgi:hypothetical protein